MTRLRSLGLGAVVVLLGATGVGAPRAGQESVLWAVTFTPGPGWKDNVRPDSQAYFREHSRNLGQLRRDSVIVAGGRFGRFGLMIMKGTSDAEVHQRFANDSTIVTRVFDITVDRWYTVYGGTLSR